MKNILLCKTKVINTGLWSLTKMDCLSALKWGQMLISWCLHVFGVQAVVNIRCTVVLRPSLFPLFSPWFAPKALICQSNEPGVSGVWFTFSNNKLTFCIRRLPSLCALIGCCQAAATAHWRNTKTKQIQPKQTNKLQSGGTVESAVCHFVYSFNLISQDKDFE